MSTAEAFTFELAERPEKRGPFIIIPHLHRRPPKPPWMRGTMGRCTWCEEDILPGQRKNPARCNWHMECAHEYKLLFDWREARAVVLERDRGRCLSCGLEVGRGYHVDHIIPLHQWPARDLAALAQHNFLEWYEPWLLANLQTLCVDCHECKTVNERRAA